MACAQFTGRGWAAAANAAGGSGTRRRDLSAVGTATPTARAIAPPSGRPVDSSPMPTAPPLRDLDVPLNAVLAGASSGIGLAMLSRLLAHPGTGRVLAVSRRAEASPVLAALARLHGDRLRCLSADLADPDAAGRIAAAASGHLGEVHLVLSSVGVLHGDGLRPEKSISQLGAASLSTAFAVNAMGPILLARALLPLLPRQRSAVLAALSARVGSIGDNALGGWYAYRASKAALNQLWRTLAVECLRTHPRAACVLLHPGTVDTPLSAPFSARVPAERLFTPEQAADQLLGILAGLGPEDSGRFIAWDGRDIPW